LRKALNIHIAKNGTLTKLTDSGSKIQNGLFQCSIYRFTDSGAAGQSGIENGLFGPISECLKHLKRKTRFILNISYGIRRMKMTSIPPE